MGCHIDIIDVTDVTSWPFAYVRFEITILCLNNKAEDTMESSALDTDGDYDTDSYDEGSSIESLEESPTDVDEGSSLCSLSESPTDSDEESESSPVSVDFQAIQSNKRPPALPPSYVHIAEMLANKTADISRLNLLTYDPDELQRYLSEDSELSSLSLRSLLELCVKRRGKISKSWRDFRPFFIEEGYCSNSKFWDLNAGFRELIQNWFMP